MESSITNLSISIKNAVNQTSLLSEYYDKNATVVIFNPNVTEPPVDTSEYCRLINSIKIYTENIPPFPEAAVVKEKMQSMTSVKEKDFELHLLSLPLWLWLVLLPLGIAAMCYRYFRLASLTGKLNEIYSKLNTIDFLLGTQGR